MHEAKINESPPFLTQVSDNDGTIYNIHFAALFSANSKAAPLLFLHGRPGSYLEFHPVLDLLRTKYTPETLPYHIVVPSLPEFLFSPLPVLDRDFEAEDVARIFDYLARGLFGEADYIVQGGDIGSRIARVMGATFLAAKVRFSRIISLLVCLTNCMLQRFIVSTMTIDRRCILRR